MSTNRNNKKGLLLLTLLVGFSFWCIKNVGTAKSEISAIENPEVVTQIEAFVVADDSNSDTYYQLTEDGVEEVQPQIVLEQDVEIDAEVLAESTADLCKQASNIFSAEEACNLPDGGNVEYEERHGGSRSSGDMVSKDSTVELVTIVAPIYLLAGSYQVEDSNWNLTSSDPTYKPAGEYFDNKTVLHTTAPGEIHDTVKSDTIDDASVMQPYSTVYSVGYTETEVKTDEGEATVQTTATTICPECNKQPNDNPDKSNKMADYLENIFMTSPSSSSISTDWTAELSFGEECTDLDQIEVDQDNGEVCQKRWGEIIWTTITSIFSSSRWSACNTPELVVDADGNESYEYSEDCIDSESIFVKMNPIFTETSSYTQLRSKVVKSPEDASNFENKFFVTDCQAKVDGKIVSVKCAWDLGVLLDERDFAQYDDAGGSETPSEEAYIKYLQQESSTRTDPIVTL